MKKTIDLKQRIVGSVAMLTLTGAAIAGFVAATPASASKQTSASIMSKARPIAQQTVAPTEPPPAPTEPPPAPTEPPPAPTEPPPVPTEPPPAPTEPPPAPTEPPPVPTAAPTNPAPKPTELPAPKPTDTPVPKPTDTPKQPDAPKATDVPATAVPTLASTATATIAVGTDCTVSLRTGLLVRSAPSRTAKALGVAFRTNTFVAGGRSLNNGWVYGLSKDGARGWVLARGLTCKTAIRNLSVLAPKNVSTSPETPVTPAPTPEATRKP